MPVRRWLTDSIISFLTEPLPYYERRVWNDPKALRRHIRKGDVLLVNGDNRVSSIIRYQASEQTALVAARGSSR